MSEPTTIHWLTLPRNGNGGAALVTWRQSTQDSMVDYWHKRISYLLGGQPPRYPLPAIPMHVAWNGWNEPVVWETYRDTFDDVPRVTPICNIGDWEYLLHW